MVNQTSTVVYKGWLGGQERAKMKALNPIGPDVYFEHFKKLRFLKKVNYKNLFCVYKQYKQLQLEKPSGIDFEMPIHKRLAINLLLRVGQKVLPLGSYRVKVVRSP